MQMDSRIILAGQQPDILGILDRSNQAAQSQIGNQRQNALAQLYQTQGPGIMAGDPGALNALAQFDPQAAMQAQSAVTQQQRGAVMASREDELWRRQTEEYAASKTAAERAQEAAQIEDAVKMGLAVQSPQEWDMLMTQMGAQDLVGQFEMRDAIANKYMSIADILKGQGGEGFTLSPGQTRFEGNKPVASLPAAPDADATALQKNYEYALSQGMAPEQARAWVSNAPVTNLNMPKAETAFETEVAKAQAGMFTGMAQEGVNANAELAQIDMIDQLLSSGVGGTADAWKSWAQDALGVNVGAGGNVEALNAAVNKLVPSQRPPGSGTMSDRDVALFKSSLPQLVNSPEGNKIIVETMRGMAEYKRKQGDIASAVVTGQITREKGMAMLKDLPDPMARAKDFLSGKPKPPPAPAPRGPSVGDVEDGYRFKGGDPSNPESWEPVP